MIASDPVPYLVCLVVLYFAILVKRTARARQRQQMLLVHMAHAEAIARLERIGIIG